MSYNSSSQQAAATVGAEKTQSIENGSGVDEIQRLQMDLNVVADKITLCREMLLVSPGIHQDEALAEVIGFLEACGDRMSELIEAAGMQQQGSMMDEDMFARCFSINDALQQTLDAERVRLILFHYITYFYQSPFIFFTVEPFSYFFLLYFFILIVFVRTIILDRYSFVG